MKKFDSNGVRLAYIDQGTGDAVLLIHGFCTNLEYNWIRNGWVDELIKSGFRVVGLDNRGHGRSKKLYDPSDYALDDMAADEFRLLELLDIERVHVIGYSLGARIATVFALNYPERIRTLTLGGLGDLNAVQGLSSGGSVLRALEAPSIEYALDFAARSVRVFAESTGSNLKAMAACLKKGGTETIPKEKYAQIKVPVLVALGDSDVIAGSAEKLAALIPNGEALIIEGLGHLNAMANDEFIIGARAFIERHS